MTKHDQKVRATLEKNLAIFMDRGPSLSSDKRTVILAVDPWTDTYLTGGLGAMGVGEMWSTASADDYHVARLVQAIADGCPIERQRMDQKFMGAQPGTDGVIRQLLDELRPGWEETTPRSVLLTLPDTWSWNLHDGRKLAEADMTADPDLNDVEIKAASPEGAMVLRFDRDGLVELRWERSSSGE